jgi:transcription antitermination factor NusG
VLMRRERAELRNRSWFAVSVRARHEKRVASSLDGKGYQVFLPTYRKRNKDRRTFDLPLFPGYVFSRLEPAETHPVLTVPGVYSILGNGRGPEPIPDQELEIVRTVAESRSMPVPWPYPPGGEKVFVVDGPLRGVQGVLLDTADQNWFVLSVDFLQRSVALKVEREALRRFADPY